MTETLIQAELWTVGDVAELDTAEAAELFDELRAASVPLGDRARLRKVAWVHSSAGDREQRGGPGEQSALMPAVQSGSLPPFYDNFGDKTANEHHRQLQSGGGVSIEIAAIAFTGLVGMVGYIVQARSMQAATKAQAGLEFDAAEQDKAESRAAIKLGRVQDQMRLFVMPLFTDILHVYWGIMSVGRELQLDDFLALYHQHYESFAAAPHMEIFSLSREEAPAFAAAVVSAPFFKLSPDDVGTLASDPTKRQRYTELVEHTWLPPLRRIERTIATESHLNEPTAMGEFLAAMPGDTTLASAAATGAFGTTNILLWLTQVYVGQLESLVGRWAAGDYELLQVGHSLVASAPPTTAPSLVPHVMDHHYWCGSMIPDDDPNDAGRVSCRCSRHWRRRAGTR
jgi:hypothetical protein